MSLATCIAVPHLRVVTTQLAVAASGQCQWPTGGCHSEWSLALAGGRIAAPSAGAPQHCWQPACARPPSCSHLWHSGCSSGTPASRDGNDVKDPCRHSLWHTCTVHCVQCTASDRLCATPLWHRSQMAAPRRTWLWPVHTHSHTHVTNPSGASPWHPSCWPSAGSSFGWPSTSSRHWQPRRRRHRHRHRHPRLHHQHRPHWQKRRHRWRQH